MRNFRWYVSIMAVVALAIAVAAVQFSQAPSAVAAEPSGCSDVATYRVCLTDPALHDDGQDTTIVDELQRQVAETQEGDAIRVSMYEWKLEPIAHELVAAQGRGVDVQVVIGYPGDGDDPNQPVEDILVDGGIPVTQCEYSCLPNGDGVKRGPNHNKFFLISSGDSTKVLQFSANITRGQLTHPQNMLISQDDQALFDFYTGYWDRMNAGSWEYDGVTWDEEDKAAKGDNDLSKGYVFPRAKGDIVNSVLNNVEECREGNDKIWVVQSLFDQQREAVLDRLLQLENDMGCDVRIAVLHSEDYEWITQRFPADKVELRDNHNKLVVADAKYAGEWRSVVFTGSHNLTRNSLRNANDAMLRVINPEVADIYAQYAQHLFADGAPPK